MNNAPLIRLEDYLPPEYLIDRVNLDFYLHPTQTRVISTMLIHKNPNGFSGTPLVLDGDELKFITMKLDGKAVASEAFTVTPEKLVFPNPPQRAFTLTIETEINPSANTKLMGLFRSNGVYCTQCEAEGFRRISYFPDRPDVMAVWSVRIEADKTDAPLLLSNGNPAASGDVAGKNRHYAYWNDPHPKPSYLFALVGGNLGSIRDSFVTSSGRKVQLNIYVEPGKEANASYAMESLKHSMRWDEEVFGCEYDLDVFNIVAVSDFNMGAMENKGLNVFNDRYILASSDSATDMDYHNIESIVAHEYFHNWTGNRITCRDWFQLCLKEGLTVFRDQEFSSDMRSRAVERIGAVRTLRASQFVEDAGPLAHNVRPRAYKEISNFYTATVYNKGAELIRMLKTLIGAEAFAKGMALYFKRHDGHAAIIEQFIQCFADVSGHDMSQFMLWYEQAGTPTVKITQHYDAVRQEYTLNFAQSTPPTPECKIKKPFIMPISFGLLSEQGAALYDSKTPFVLKDDCGTLVLGGIKSRPVPSLFREFSAPVKVDFDLSDEDLLVLAQYDSDSFNRWQALQTYSTRFLLRSIRAIQAGKAPLQEATLGKAFQRLLEEGLKDPAFAALALTLPSENDLARDLGTNIDPDAIGKARDSLRKSIAEQCFTQAQKLHDALSLDAPFSVDAKSAGRRSLRAVALGLMVLGNEAVGSRTAINQFETAKTMTDRLAALEALLSGNKTIRDQALKEFEQKYKDNPLILDHWFGLQARIADDEAIARIQNLMQHPGFSATNPNRIRALVGTFAMGNPRQFNREDGAGYRFLADFVGALDQANPQTAARMANAFRSWRQLEPVRSKAAKAALESLKTKTLSRDMSDIVERSLA